MPEIKVLYGFREHLKGRMDMSMQKSRPYCSRNSAGDALKNRQARMSARSTRLAGASGVSVISRPVSVIRRIISGIGRAERISVASMACQEKNSMSEAKPSGP